MKKPPFSLGFWIYRAFGRLAAPFVARVLAKRVANGKEDSARLSERHGHAGLPRPEGILLWFHAASVGETMSILPLIEALVSEGRRVLLTTGTLTSAELAARRLPEGAVHQFLPVDLPGPVDRFLDHWRPDLAVFCESELWPNLMISAQRRGIPLGIVNGRMSDRSHARWSRLKGLSRAMLANLVFCLTQTGIDAERYADLGASPRATGNLKFDVPALPFDAELLAKFKDALKGRPVLVAASTHPGEDSTILDAVAKIRSRHPDLVTVIVPRHPERGDEIAAMAAAGGLVLPRRSAGAVPDDDTLVYLADTLGELGLFYRLADIAFVGGTLAPIGGHNPIEPIKLDVPVLHGPETHKNREIYDSLAAADATIQIGGDNDLARQVNRLLEDEQARADLAARARAVVSGAEGALATTLTAIAEILPKARP